MYSDLVHLQLDYQQLVRPTISVRNCCLSCSPKPIDLMEDQQLHNLDGPLDQQHFIVIKLQYKYLLHFSTLCRVFYKFILWRTTHFFHGPTVFLNYWSSGPGSNFAKGRTLPTIDLQSVWPAIGWPPIGVTCKWVTCKWVTSKWCDLQLVRPETGTTYNWCDTISLTWLIKLQLVWPAINVIYTCIY